MKVSRKSPRGRAGQLENNQGNQTGGEPENRGVTGDAVQIAARVIVRQAAAALPSAKLRTGAGHVARLVLFIVGKYCKVRPLPFPI